MSQAGEALKTSLDSNQSTMEASFTEAVTKLSDSSSEIFLQSHMNLNRAFESIASGIESINRSLRDLGEKQIPNEAKKKRGFFSKK